MPANTFGLMLGIAGLAFGAWTLGRSRVQSTRLLAGVGTAMSIFGIALHVGA